MKPDFERRHEPYPNDGGSAVKPRREPARARTWAALAIALLAPALGGGTSPGAVAAISLGIGLALLLAPPHRVPRGFFWLGAILLLATLTWVLPARLFSLPWRSQLKIEYFPLGSTVSPEPWISFRSWLLLIVGLGWLAWCLGQSWARRERRTICAGLALGIGAIAGIALPGAGRSLGWPPGTGLGPFPNRNQTALLFAIGAFLAVVCGVEAFRRSRRGKRIAWLALWFCLLCLYTVALGVNRSRSGPALFAGMTLCWALASVTRSRQKPKTLAIGAAFVLLLGAVFVITGGNVIARLASTTPGDFRLRIYSDTLRLILSSPWTGAGLGCFHAVFPLYRNASLIQEMVLHPESDWLWLTAEAGLPGLLAMVGLAAWLAARAWKNLGAREAASRQAAWCIACLGMLAHCMIDVPGHRLGTLVPMLLLLGVAAGGDENAAPDASRGFRAAGAAIAAAGAAALAAIALRIPLPIANGVLLLEQQASRERFAGRPADAVATLGKALRWAPLDWELYFERARDEQALRQVLAALGDFRRANYLQKGFYGLPLAEGIDWLGVAPQFSLGPWNEALLLAPYGELPRLYRRMMDSAYAAHPELHPALWRLAGADPRIEVICFGWASPDEFKAHIGEVLRADPSLDKFSADDLQQLLPLWLHKGDPDQMAALLQRSPNLLSRGYHSLAEYEAGQGDFRDAVNLMAQYGPKPLFPKPIAIGAPEAARRFLASHADFAAGMALYAAGIAHSREADALDALRAMSASPGCPAYVHWLAAQLLLKQGRLGDAWSEFELYTALPVQR